MVTGSGNVHGFTGKELDAEMGLNYFCQRYYDSQIGIFMSLDPVDQKGASPYAYCTNNPIKFTDPTGMLDRSLVEKIPYNFSEEEWSWIDQNINHLNIEDKDGTAMGWNWHMGWFNGELYEGTS